MKICPQCGREYDMSMSFCLDDGEGLLYGPATEPSTAILQDTSSVREAATLAHIRTTTDKTAVLGSAADQPVARGFDKRLLIAPFIVVIALAGFTGYKYFRSSAAEQINSIAVMPFVNASGTEDVEYLSDGLTETLIGSLSKLGDLSVKARSAVFAYKGRDISPKQVGDELGVQAVLLGRLVQRGDNIRLNLELVNPRTLDVIWSEQYDRKQVDLVNLQTEIARDVSSKLRSKLSGADQQALSKKYTNDPEAYRLYLQGRFYLNKRVGREYEKAEGYLQQAIERDPNFALGYTGLAEFIAQRDRPKSKEYIARALALDNQLSDAHAILGFQFTLDRNWPMAERELNRAIELDPDNWQAHQWNGTRLMMIGRFDECLAEYDRAIAMEPAQADIRNNRAACLVAAGRIDDGIAEVKKGMTIDPSYAWQYSHISFLYRMKGDYAASVEARARAAELVDRPELAAKLRNAFREEGPKGYLRALLDQTKDQFPNEVRRASILTELGHKDEALAALEESARKGEWWLFSIKYDPAFDPIRSEPRFQAIEKQFDPPQ